TSATPSSLPTHPAGRYTTCGTPRSPTPPRTAPTPAPSWPTLATPPWPASPATPASHPTPSPAGRPAATSTADTDQARSPDQVGSEATRPVSAVFRPHLHWSDWNGEGVAGCITGLRSSSVKVGVQIDS